MASRSLVYAYEYARWNTALDEMHFSTLLVCGERVDSPSVVDLEAAVRHPLDGGLSMAPLVSWPLRRIFPKLLGSRLRVLGRGVVLDCRLAFAVDVLLSRCFDLHPFLV